MTEKAEELKTKYQVEKNENSKLNSEVKRLQQQLKSLLAQDHKSETQPCDDKVQNEVVIERLQGRIKQLNEDLDSLREHSKTQSRDIVAFRQNTDVSYTCSMTFCGE